MFALRISYLHLPFRSSRPCPPLPPPRAWLPEQTAGTDAELKASIAALHLRAALHLPLRANAFADWDENPKTRRLAPDGQDACPPSAVACAADATPHLADASLHCCPSGYRCFVHAPAKDSGVCASAWIYFSVTV